MNNNLFIVIPFQEPDDWTAEEEEEEEAEKEEWEYQYYF